MGPLMEELENKLICKIAQQDKLAFEELVQLSYSKLYRYIRRLAGNHRDIEDMMQEGYMAVWSNADKFNPSQPANPWLYKIFYHKFIDYTRKGTDQDLPILNDPAVECRLDEDIWLKQKRELVQRFVMKLDSKDKAIFVLFYYQQITAKDIALIVDTSEQAVQSSLYRLRKALKASVEGH